MSHPLPILVLTGAAGAGKTRLCMQATRLLQQSAAMVAGLLSPARMENGQKTGIFVEDIASGERRLLAEHPHGQQTRWNLDPAALQWGAEILRTLPPYDVLVVDELGPLELEKGEGWIVACDLLTKNPAAAMIVVRPSLIDHFRQRVSGRDVKVIEVTEQSPSAEDIVALLWTDTPDERQ